MNATKQLPWPTIEEADEVGSPLTTTQDRLEQLEDAIKQVRIQARALQIMLMGENDWRSSGYYWCVRQATDEQRARVRVEEERLVARADLSAQSILTATKAAVAQSRTATVRAGDVALAILPEAAPPKTLGRQMLIARVGAEMRRLVAAGKLVRVAAPRGT